MGFLWYGPSRVRIPAIVPGIPLALTSIVLSVLACTLGVLKAFQDIAAQKATGLRSLADSIAGAMGSLPRAITISIGCVVALTIFQVIRDRWYQQPPLTEEVEWNVPRTVFFWSLLSGLATAALLWLLQSSIDLIFLVADPARRSEAELRLGQTQIAELAGMIAHRFYWSGLLSLGITALLLQAAQLSLQAGEVSGWIRKKYLIIAIVSIACIVPPGIALHRESRYLVSLINAK